MQLFFSTLNFAKDCTARDMLIIHTQERSISNTRDNQEGSVSNTRDNRSEIDVVSSPQISGEEIHKDDEIFCPTHDYLERLSMYSPNISFINPSVSIAWKSPRGIAQVVRIVLLQCVEFFMKTIHHSLEAKRFFFTKRMTIRLMCDPVFIQAVDKREMTTVLSRLREEDEDSDKIPKEGEYHAPDPSDVFELLHPSSHSSHEGELLNPSSSSSSSHGTREGIEPDGDRDPDLLSHYNSLSVPTAVNMKTYASFRFYMQNRFEIICQRFYHRFPIVLYCMTSSFIFFPETCVAMECKGADELLGYYSWLNASIEYISHNFLPYIFAHFNLTIRKDTQIIQDMIPVMNRSYMDNIEKMKKMEQHQMSKWSIYNNSPYPDGGIHYKFLLMLIDKFPSFGQENNYCKMCSFVCKVVVQLSYLLYPDLLEKNHIHIPPPPQSENESTHRFSGPSSQELFQELRDVSQSTGERRTESCEEETDKEKSIFVFRASASDM
jgi:hypothetical protein